MRDVLVVPTESVRCKDGLHDDCPARELIGRDLYVCICSCHDGGERRPEPELEPDSDPLPGTSEFARKMGSRGGKKGGPARARALKPGKRQAIALLAAATRWGHGKQRIDALRDRVKEES